MSPALLINCAKRLPRLSIIGITSLASSRIACALALAACANVAVGQSFPSRPLRLIVGFAPGGAVDIAARIVARKMSENLGQQVVIENRSGAGGIVAMELTAKAAPDGYTFHLASNGPLVVSPHAQSNLGYDVKRDLAPLSLAVTFSNVIVLHPGVNAKTLKEWLDIGRGKSGGLAYASSGVASTGHLAGELLRLRSGVELTHVAYKGGGPAMNDLLGGQIGAMIATVPTSLPHIKAGKLRAIAVTSARRAEALPDVPTIAESGFPDFEAQNWYAFVAPARVPRELLARLQTEIVRALRAQDVKEQLHANGMDSIPSTADEMAAYVDRESAVWARVVKASNLRME